MYLAEVNEEVLRKCLRAEGYEEGYDAGYDSGYDSGEYNHLIQQITKKISAGKPLEQIAAEVEESVDNIKELYETILQELSQIQ